MVLCTFLAFRGYLILQEINVSLQGVTQYL